MLKRKGYVVRHSVDRMPPVLGVIQPELDQLTNLNRQIDRCRYPIDSPTKTAVLVVEGVEWPVQRRLLELPASEMFLCRDPRTPGFAIIQQFQENSAYAQVNGSAEILATGANPRQLVRDYADDARHTLRFMASNLVAQAQRVTWEQFPEHNPARMVRAISERCQQIAGIHEAVRQHAGQPGVSV